MSDRPTQALEWALKQKYPSVSARYAKEIAEYSVQMEIDLEELKKWIDDLQSGMYINCVYCGHRYPPGSGDVMSEVLYEHIRICPKHPLAKAEAEIAQLRNDCAPFQSQIDQRKTYRATEPEALEAGGE